MVNEKGDECAKVHEGLPMPQKDKFGQGMHRYGKNTFRTDTHPK